MTRFLAQPVIRVLILFGLLGSMLYNLQDGLQLKDRLAHFVFERYMEIKPRPALDKIVFVDIDDASLSAIGQWPWPRHILAEMVRNINAAGAKAIIFDGVIAEPDRTSPDYLAELLPEDHPAQDALSAMPAQDTLLATAIAEAGNFVAGFTYGSNPMPPMVKGRILARKAERDFFLQACNRCYFAGNAQFLPEMQNAAAGNGSFMASLDADAIIRRTGLIFHNGKTLYPSLLLEGLRVYRDDHKGFAKLDFNTTLADNPFQAPFSLRFADKTIPLDVEGKMWVYYNRFDPAAQLSASMFIGAESLPDLAGKIVFIASEAEGLKDLRATPIGNIAGVKIHINAMEQILQDIHLIRPQKANDIEIFTAAGLCALIIGLSFVLGSLPLMVLTGFTVGGLSYSSWLAFEHYGLLFDPVTPSILILVIFTFAAILSFLRTELEKHHIRYAFGRYISPDFMKELTDNPDKLKLGGETKELTIMFTDIRRFTSICEGLSSEEVIHLMNDFLTPMSDLVMSHRGTIDKYMGDAMMAFWNAPLDDPDHAANACTAALKMQAALEPVNAAVKARAEEIGKYPVLLQAGIGINTGESAVGNMGSRQRFAYSTLGDPVNLASRLEGQTKTYGVGILVGESTITAARDFAALEVDLIRVKGKQKPERIFVLLGDPAMAADTDFVALKSAHEAMLKAYRTQDFIAAQHHAQNCKTQKSARALHALYDLYTQRCTDFSADPPPTDWDGVYEATSK